VPTELSDKIRAGIVGAGVFGGYHAQKYTALESATLTAVFDADINRAKMFAENHNINYYTDYREFLTHIDVVSITTPATTHFKLAHEALLRGRHCLVEKPVATCLDDAKALISQAKSSDLCLQVGHQERFVAAAAGLFDEPHQLEYGCWRRCGPASGRCEDVSVVFDLMIHDLDLARQFGVGEPVTIEASGDADEVHASLYFQEGRRFDFVASRRCEEQDRSLILDYGDHQRRYDFTVANSGISDPLLFGVAQFIEAVAGHQPVAISGYDGLRALEWARLIEDAWRHSASKKHEAVA